LGSIQSYKMTAPLSRLLFGPDHEVRAKPEMAMLVCDP
jgi:hypothetical protein